MSPHRTEWLTALGAFVLTIATVFLIGPRDFMTGDTTHYLMMVRNELTPAPFGYRLATPAIVAILPWPPAVGFFLIAYAATFGTLWVMRAIFRHLGVSPAASTAASSLLCFSYPMANYLSRWGRVDPLANFVFALSLLLILRRSFAPAAMLLAAGVLAKESTLFLVPLLFYHRIKGQTRDRSAYLSAALLCLLPVLSLVTVRATVEVREGSFTVENSEDLDRVWQEVWDYNVEEFGLVRRLGRELTKSYGFFWVLAALGLLIEQRLRLESLYLIAVGVLLCFVATDWSRMLGTGFPGVFIPAAFLLDRMRAGRHWRPLLAGLLSLSVAHCYLSLLIYRDLEPTGQMAMVAGELLVVLAGTGLVVWGYFDSSRSAANIAQTPARHSNA